MRVENKLSYQRAYFKNNLDNKTPSCHLAGQSSRFWRDSILLQDIECTSSPNSYAIHHRKEEWGDLSRKKAELKGY